MLRYFTRKTAKPLIRDAVEEVASADVRAAATSGAHGAINTESRSAAQAAAQAATHETIEAMSKQSTAVAREANAANRIRANYLGVATVLTPVLAAGGAGVTIWRTEQTARDMGAKGAEMAKDMLKALHDDMEAALQAIGSIPQGLTDGLNISGPVRTLIQAGSTAVMVGGAIFTVYGTYRLFR